MKRIKKNCINILFSILIVCLLMTSAMALYNDEGWPVENRINGTINGGVFYDCIEWSESTSLTLSTDVPNGTIRYAYLYTGIWGGNKDNTGWMDVNFNGDHTSHDLGPILLQGKNDVNDNVWCSGYGKYWLKYNVTELVKIGEINTATTSKINGSIDGRVYGIVLVVVYEGGDDPKTIRYWINDGSDQLSDVSPEVTTDFPGTVNNNNNIVKADLMTVHLTGYEPICNDCIKFNNHSMDTSCINTNSFDMHTWNVTDYVEATGNNAWFSRGSDPYVSICNAVLIIELEEEEEAPKGADLNITQMLINPGNVRTEDILRIYVNDNNTISAVIQNNGPDEEIDDFDVCFEADGMDIGCVTVSGGLAAGANTTISIDWTPVCADYPVIPGFPPQSLPVTINVTINNNTESTFSKLIPAIQEYSNYSVMGGMVNNGYRSKNFDCDTDKDSLDQFKYYSLVGGGVEYNINGEKISSFDAQAVDTRNHQINLPDGVTVVDARLYVYWYDKWGNYKEYPTGCLANLSVNFESIDILPDAIYQDSKGFGYYQSPKGSTVFNVTSLVSGSGNYTAVVKNIEPEAGNSTTLLGEMLVVVYEGADSSSNTQIWMLEGCDYLMAADETHGSKHFSVSPDEATATVSFAGNFDPAAVQSARLITVVSQGMENESDLLFNGNVIKTDAWEASTEISGKINVEDVLLQSDLVANDNNVGFKDNGTAGMQAVNAILIICQEEEEAPPTGADLNITQMLINPGNVRAEDILRVYVNDNNTISAVIRNNGPDDVTDDFDVCFEADGMDIGCVTVSGGLAAGANTTISIDWTPACVDYPVIPGFPSQSLPVTINITVDNNTENIFSKLIPAMQEYSNYSVIGGMVNNGYRSTNFDCDTDKDPLDQFKYYSLVGGGVEYNINGEKISSFDAQAVDTRNHQIDLPDGVTVVDARLYVYWYDKWGNYKEYPTGCLANLSVNFESIDILPDAIYQDSKGFGYYQSPKGSTVFNVTSLVSGSGNYTAVVKNIEPEAGNSTTLLGEMLVVVYEGADSSSNTQIWMLEGCDYLMAADETHGSNDYSISPDEATATVSFAGNLDPAAVQNARLITVVAQGMDNESDLLFNGNIIKTDAWEASTEISGKINVEDVLVQSDLVANDNNVGFKDNGTGGMQAVNAILIICREEEEAPPTGADLNITQMLINPGNVRAEDILRVYVNDNNAISAVIRNNGPDEVIDDFDVCFEADGMDIGCVTVSGGLAAGANTTISIDWTPACVDYPVIPGFLPQPLSVTMDCIPECVDDPEVPECVDDPEVPEDVDDPETPGFPPRSLPVTINITVDNNTENTFSKLIPAMQEYSNYSVIGGMVNNGYRSKNFDCDTDKDPLDLFKYYSLVGGGVEYNINGEKISSFDAQAVDTRNHQINLPDGVTVVDARLYVYWYDKWGNYKEYPTGCLANLSVNFESIDILADAIYQDSKGFGYYQSPKGSTVFNVTSLVSGSGNYTAVVKNIEPGAGNSTTLLGEMLVVVYEGADSSSNTRIWMLEGCDYLMAADEIHGSNDYSVSPDEATATVSFAGNLDLAAVQSARLITVVSQGMDNESDLLLNGNVIKTDAWEAGTEISGKINVEDVLVQSDLLASENNMGFKDNGTGGMQAVNAFLLVTTKESDSGSSSNVVVSE